MEIPSSEILAGSVAADYAKRFLDQHGYDKVIAVARHHGFMPKSKFGKNITELIAYITGGILDYNLGEKSFMAKFAKEVIGDIPSELAQRMHSGAKSSVQFMNKDTAADGPHAPAGSMSNVLVVLDSASRDQVLALMVAMDTPARKAFSQTLVEMSVEDLKHLGSLTEIQRSRLVSMIAEMSTPRRIQPLKRLDNAANTLAEGLFPWTKDR